MHQATALPRPAPGLSAGPVPAPAGSLPLRVAIVGTNDPRNFSGGRYHGLMLAYAIAAAGGEAHVVTDHVPGFVPDLEPLAPGRVRMHQSHDFRANLPEGRFDWVLVVPTGIFLPDFYESALDFAAAAGARVGLVNFETGSWFNAMAPEPRDPRLWDYWRRLVAEGGLVLSSARVSDAWARGYYATAGGALRFEVWNPPINSLAARRFDGMAKDGSILAFVRPQDRHKGSAAITALEPSLLAGRTLRLVSGRDVPDSFRAEVEAHLARASGSRLEILLRIPDLQKFRLLTMAQAVLFPTRFEGFGYPPVEAAYAGTESVCSDLPVVRETVGGIAHFAPPGDMESFNLALEAALARPERRAELRAAVHRFADFGESALLLADVLLRSADAVAPLRPRDFRVAVGPFAKAPVRAPDSVARDEPVPPAPARVAQALRTTAGEVLVSGEAFWPAAPDRMEALGEAGGPALPLSWQAGPAGAGGMVPVAFQLLAPEGMERRRLSVAGFAGGAPLGEPLQLQVDRVAPADPARPVRAGISENAVQGDARVLRGWVLARAALSAIRFTPDGRRWFTAAMATERRDVLAKNPGYPSARCEFRLRLPLDAEPDPAAARILCLDEHGVAVDLLVGWTPAPRPHFAPGLALGPEVPLPAPPAPPARAAAAAPAAPAAAAAPPALPLRRAVLGTLELIDHSDRNWSAGIARRGEAGRLGAVLVRRNEHLAAAVPGTVLRFASGAARRVLRAEPKDNTAVLVLNGPVPALGNGFPQRVTLLAAQEAVPPAATFSLNEWTDTRWWRGVWNLRDQRWRCGFFLPKDQAEALQIGVGSLLSFPASGLREVRSLQQDGGKNMRVWLDQPVRPLADGAPRLITVVKPVAEAAGPGALCFSLARQEAGWPAGVLDHGPLAGRQALLRPEAAAQVRRGTALRFQPDLLLRVLEAVPEQDGLVVTLSGAIDPALHGHPAVASLVDEAEIPAGIRPSYLYPDPGLKGPDPLHAALVADARARGRVLPAPPRALPAGPRRALLLSPVSPAPANQGNRVVTRNLIRHLVGLGFAVDVVVQNWVDGWQTAREFGPGVRLVGTAFPKWDETDAAHQRRAVAEAASRLRSNPMDAPVAAAFAEAAEHFHPFFVVRDETVEIARSLYAAQHYDTIVCNYTHMARVAKELEAVRPLPSVAIVTHDALSRLPREFRGSKLDTSYRATTAAMERAALDAVPGAVVVAISESEASYFGEIGTANPVVLCEYDAAEEMAPFAVPPDSFGRRSIIFHGSANPMNIAGLDWFVDECWAEIQAAVPDARLVVCGRVGEKWNPGLPGIEVVGEQPREAMLALCSAASMTINPCVAGTGLKIKTVEAACLGLPAVCLPLAVEGLEAVAPRFAMVERDAEGFAAACIRLMTDEPHWQALHEGALAVAGERFSANAVYGALDAAMGWTPAAVPEQALPGAGLAAGPDLALPVGAAATGPGGAPDDALLLALGRRMIDGGQGALGWGMVASVADRHAGDPGVAAEAARAAAAVGEDWLALQHAVVVIGQRPAEAEGYRLGGQALLRLGLLPDAIACLQQGALVAPGDEAMLRLLCEALSVAGREEEAARWATLRALELVPGRYVALDAASVGPGVARGWQVGADGALELPAGSGTLRIALREAGAGALMLDLSVPAGGILSCRLGRLVTEMALGEGPTTRTLRLPVTPEMSQEDQVVLQLDLDDGGWPAGGIRLIGLGLDGG